MCWPSWSWSRGLSHAATLLLSHSFFPGSVCKARFSTDTSLQGMLAHSFQLPPPFLSFLCSSLHRVLPIFFASFLFLLGSLHSNAPSPSKGCQ